MGMKTCKCGSKTFEIPTLFTGWTRIEIEEDDSEEFEVIDTDPQDGEWQEDDLVTCCECGEQIPYSEWNPSDPPEPRVVLGKEFIDILAKNIQHFLTHGHDTDPL